MCLQSIGIGIGVGVVHASILFLVMLAARTNAKRQENDTLELIRERNALDRDKVGWLEEIAEAIGRDPRTHDPRKR